MPKRDKGVSGSGAETNCPRQMARLCDSTRGQGRPLGVWVTRCVGLPVKVDPGWCRERRPAISPSRNRKSQGVPAIVMLFLVLVNVFKPRSERHARGRRELSQLEIEELIAEASYEAQMAKLRASGPHRQS